MEKKTLLAVALSLLVIISYPLIIQKFFPQTVVVQQPQIDAPKINTITQDIVKKEVTPTQPPPSLATEKTHQISTNYLDLTFTNLGGCIKEVSLKALPSVSKAIKLVDAFFPQEAALNITDPSGSLPLGIQAYSLSQSDDKIFYNAIFDNKIEVIKTFILHRDAYYLDFELSLKNVTDKPIEVGYAIGAGSLVESDPVEARFLEAVLKTGTKIVKDTTGSVRRGFIVRNGPTDWVGIKNKYFSLALKPEAKGAGSCVRLVGNNGLCTSLIMAPQTIPPNTSIIHKFILYAGPMDSKKMTELGIGEVAGFGMLYAIGNGLLAILKLFFLLVRNWGIAIILLTILINIILFPLTRKSYKSIQEMQVLQPQIAKLQKELKDNPQKLNKEIMELYKKHKVNPFGGCLPMLLQLPIFISLYQTLSRSIELKGAKFLWIKDLSEPDKAFSFGTRLPIVGDSINILPILMMLAMYIQQKISSPKAVDKTQEQQQAIMKIMPLIFGLFFYSLPSGLVIYWLLQTVLMAAYQYRLMHAKSVSLAS